MDSELKEYMHKGMHQAALKEYVLNDLGGGAWGIDVTSLNKRFPMPSRDLAEKVHALLVAQYAASLIAAFERTWSFKAVVVDAVELLKRSNPQQGGPAYSAMHKLMNLLEPEGR